MGSGRCSLLFDSSRWPRDIESPDDRSGICLRGCGDLYRCDRAIFTKQYNAYLAFRRKTGAAAAVTKTEVGLNIISEK